MFRSDEEYKQILDQLERDLEALYPKRNALRNQVVAPEGIHPAPDAVSSNTRNLGQITKEEHQRRLNDRIEYLLENFQERKEEADRARERMKIFLSRRLDVVKKD